MTLAEKIESILHTRQDGKLGQYHGSTARVFGSCSIDGNVYHVKFNNSVDSTPRWGIRNTTNNTVAYTNEDYLCYADTFVPMTSELRDEWNKFGYNI